MIAGRVGAISQQPLEDLRSLRATCKNMRCACSFRDVDRHLAIERVREELSWSHPTEYEALLAMLNDLGNSEAAFMSGVVAVFGRNDNCLNDDLRRAADSGHNATAYLYAIVLYGANADTAIDDSAKSYMRRVAGGGGTMMLSAARGVGLRARCPRMPSTQGRGTGGANRCWGYSRCAAKFGAPARDGAACTKGGNKSRSFAARTTVFAAKW